MIAARTPKPRKCRECRTPFVPVWAMQPVCDSFACKLAYASKVAERSAAKRMAVGRKAQREDQAALKARREKLKTRRDWIKVAQACFNAYIRERDKDLPCICCGKPLTLNAIGGGYDCGHWRRWPYSESGMLSTGGWDGSG